VTTPTHPRAHLPFVLTAHGIEMVAQPGPALRGREGLPRQERAKRPDELNKTYSHHIYSSRHEFGHWNISNNVNPFLAYQALPNWSTSNKDYGVHYSHPYQTYSYGIRNRMPDFQSSV